MSFAAPSSSTSCIRLQCGQFARWRARAGSTIAAVEGRATLAYVDFERVGLDLVMPSWLGGEVPVRRVTLAEGDTHVLPWAARVIAYADGTPTAMCVVIGRPRWTGPVRVVGWLAAGRRGAADACRAAVARVRALARARS